MNVESIRTCTRDNLSNKALGQLGEKAAARYLQGCGFSIWARNFRCRTGEIDIIASRSGQLSFIEVKTRRDCSFDRPGEAVTEAKKQRIRRCAEYYLKQLEETGYRPTGISFDVVEVIIRHTESAF